MSRSKQTNGAAGADTFGETEDFVTFTIADQLFGIPVLKVQDVLSAHNITRIPLAPPEIAGSLNLRGRIVTALAVRLRLGLPTREREKSTSIVAAHAGERYRPMVAPAGRVQARTSAECGRNPPALAPTFTEYPHRTSVVE